MHKLFTKMEVVFSGILSFLSYVIMLANLTMITQSLFFPTFPSFSDTLLKTTADALGKWKDLLRNYTKTVDEEVYDSVYY